MKDYTHLYGRSSRDYKNMEMIGNLWCPLTNSEGLAETALYPFKIAVIDNSSTAYGALAVIF